MASEYDTNRRLLLLGSASGLLLSSATVAQSFDIPPLEVTIRIAEQPGSAAILYNQFSLAWSLATNVHFLRKGITAGDNADVDRNEIPPFAKPIEIWSILFGLVRDDYKDRELILSTLKKSDPLIDKTISEQHMRLVENFASQVQEFGLTESTPLLKTAVDSLAHTERIAAATVNQGSERNYFCRVFPFKYLCD